MSGLAQYQRHTGPVTARLFQVSLGLIAAIAWASLGVQVRVLAGERGLAPIRDVLEKVAAQRLSWLDFPSVLRWTPGTDGWLVAGCWIGGLLSLLAALGVLPRIALALSGVLYLGYTVACGSFLAFQWDSLLIECLFLGALLSTRRESPLVHAALRLLLFKIFLESAIAKAQSPLGDWWDGSAMTLYYQTAPIPTRLGWYAHHLPAAWHHFESRWTLFFEGVLVFGIFGPRAARLAALAAFAGFLVLDTATANYGFFTHLTAALCLFLLDEGDLLRAGAWLRARLPALSRWSGLVLPSPLPERLRAPALALVLGLWALLGAAGAAHHFTETEPLKRPVELVQQLRVDNVYHLFAAITTERVEPEIQVHDGGAWVTMDLRYKPGDPARPPPFVAPHQPRVDFRLWFYGLSYQRGVPGYVGALLSRLCDDPEAVEELFVRAVPRQADAVRLVFWRYRYTTPAERDETGDWWAREEIERSKTIPCRP